MSRKVFKLFRDKSKGAYELVLNNISKLLSPELLKVLSEMGHGDEIVIADGNFPANSNAKRLIRYDGVGAIELLTAILSVFPLDDYHPHQVYMMEVEAKDAYEPEIWGEFKTVLGETQNNFSIKHLERQKFYERSRQAYAIIATGEEKLYANIILKKGVVN